MQSNQNFPKKVMLPPANQMLCDFMRISPSVPPFNAVLPQTAKNFIPFHGVEFQPSEVCPKNFIIVDQTDNRSQIMYHPQIANKFSCPGFNIHENYIQENMERENAINEGEETSSTLKEDSDDIDALLSLEEEEEEHDEEEVSTARTNGSYGNSSPDSCSNYGSRPKRNRLSSAVLMPSSSANSCNSERKQLKLKKMVKTLRGIVPGGNRMNTVAVLDEAVRYLKSLKVEVQKLGVENFKN